MHFYTGDIYHIYNTGNNGQELFSSPGNYDYFLEKIANELLPWCDLLAYTLLPERFDLVVTPNLAGASLVSAFGDRGDIGVQALSAACGKLMSSYTRAINRERDTTGSLFRQRSHAQFCCAMPNADAVPDHAQLELLDLVSMIHSQPVVRQYVSSPADWTYSSAGIISSNGFWKPLSFTRIARSEAIPAPRLRSAV